MSINDRPTETTPAGVESSPDIMSGAPCIAGTRIPTSAVWRFHRAGFVPSEIAKQYPGLTLERIEAALKYERRQRIQRWRTGRDSRTCPVMTNNSPTQTTELRVAMDWLVGRDCSSSSKALMARMLGATPRLLDYPLDPSDLGPCLRLLRRIPAWRARIREMADCGPCWAALVARWDELESTMADEVGIDWSKGRSAPKTYALMKGILAQG